MLNIPICFKCKHYNGKDSYKCRAFPYGIPNKILLHEIGHSKPLKEQNNKIVFEEE